MYKRWTVASTDTALADELAARCGLDPVAARVAVARGLVSEDQINDFLSDEPPRFDPFTLTGIPEAAARIEEAIGNSETILVFGDYDCDGVTATALMVSYLRRMGADVRYDLPDRETGYGLHTVAIQKAADEGVTLIITVDNGINSVEEVAFAKTLGMDVVVTDHHIPQETRPDAVSLVDPYLHDEDAAFQNMAGVGVAFVLVCALAGAEPAELLWEYGDLVAAGTISDVMPLTGYNRAIVKIGLDVMLTGSRIGMTALFAAAGLGDKPITASTVSFLLAPRINAAGRMGSAMTALDLLLCDDAEEAGRLAGEICERNTRRQQVEQTIVEEAAKWIETNRRQCDRVIVVAGEGWHHGVVGIAAARLVERYARPVIVLAVNGEKAVGSGRGIAGFSLFDALNACADLTERFGGHELAAGLTISTNRIEALRQRLNSIPQTADLPFLTVKSDCILTPEEVDLEAACSLGEFEPYGAGNPVPVFLIKDMHLDRITPLSGGNHQKLTLSQGRTSFQAVLFGVKNGNLCLYEGDDVDVAVQLSINEYKGVESLSVQIKAIRKAGSGGKACEEAVRRYEALCRGELKGEPVRAMVPSREDFARVYRWISAKATAPTEAVLMALGKSVGYDKVQLCLEIMKERGLLFFDVANGMTRCTLTPVVGKVDIEASPYMQRLHELSEKEGTE